MTTPIGFWVIDRFGRRNTLIVGALWQAGWLIVFSSVAVAKDPAQNQTVGYVMIVAASLFITGFAASWGPCIWWEHFVFICYLRADMFLVGSLWVRSSPPVPARSRLASQLLRTGFGTSSLPSSHRSSLGEFCNWGKWVHILTATQRHLVQLRLHLRWLQLARRIHRHLLLVRVWWFVAGGHRPHVQRPVDQTLELASLGQQRRVPAVDGRGSAQRREEERRGASRAVARTWYWYWKRLFLARAYRVICISITPPRNKTSHHKLI